MRLSNPFGVRASKYMYLVIIRDKVFFILHKNICCDPSSELSQQDGSDEGSQHMVSVRNKKNKTFNWTG